VSCSDTSQALPPAVNPIVGSMFVGVDERAVVCAAGYFTRSHILSQSLSTKPEVHWFTKYCPQVLSTKPEVHWCADVAGTVKTMATMMTPSRCLTSKPCGSSMCSSSPLVSRPAGRVTLNRVAVRVTGQTQAWLACRQQFCTIWRFERACQLLLACSPGR
jgi:hypothetical protein